MDASPHGTLKVATAPGSVTAQIAGETLPRAPILSYLANVSTPTRVRIIAARSVKIIMWTLLALISYGVMQVAHRIWTDAHWAAGPFVIGGAFMGGRTPVLRDYVRAAIDELPSLVAYGMSLVLVFILALMIGPIRRGRPAPCVLTGIILVILIVFIGLVVSVVASVSLMVGIGVYHMRPQHEYLWWLLVVPPGVLLILLLKDLCAFLLWIARNPIVDKPPVPFLPGTKPA